jgi:hypothetical protein
MQMRMPRGHSRGPTYLRRFADPRGWTPQSQAVAVVALLVVLVGLGLSIL